MRSIALSKQDLTGMVQLGIDIDSYLYPCRCVPQNKSQREERRTIP